MFKIKFKDGRDFTGTYLSVKFTNGCGETDNAYLAERFKGKALIVEEEIKVENPFAKMKTKELEEKAVELGVDISDCKTNVERSAKLFEATQKEPEE